MQLALVWQFTKQLSGLNPFSLSNNKNYRLKKSRVFLYNKRKIQLSQKHYLENFRITDH